MALSGIQILKMLPKKARQVGIPHSPQFFLGSILRIWIPDKAILGSSVYE